MIDVSTLVVSELKKTNLKVYNENFVDSKTPVPCITYRLYDNSVLVESNNLGYSNQVYHIKVWGKDMETLVQYSGQVDNIMRALGFKRITCNDLFVDGIGQRDMKYKAISLEIFK